MAEALYKTDLVQRQVPTKAQHPRFDQSQHAHQNRSGATLVSAMHHHRRLTTEAPSLPSSLSLHRTRPQFSILISQSPPRLGVHAELTTHTTHTAHRSAQLSSVPPSAQRQVLPRAPARPAPSAQQASKLRLTIFTVQQHDASFTHSFSSTHAIKLCALLFHRVSFPPLQHFSIQSPHPWASSCCG